MQGPGQDKSQVGCIGLQQGMACRFAKSCPDVQITCSFKASISLPVTEISHFTVWKIQNIQALLGVLI